MTLDPARHYIGGEWVADGPLAASVRSRHPCSVGPVPSGQQPLADAAAATARAAFFGTDWAHAPRLRSQALLEIADRLEAAKNEIADLVVAENGKIRAEALGETMGAISETRYYAGLARDIRGSMQEITPGSLSLFHREAAGVAGIIVPWNAPVTLLTAVACACSGRWLLRRSSNRRIKRRWSMRASCRPSHRPRPCPKAWSIPSTRTASKWAAP